MLGAIDLTTDISGILPVPNGGTGASTFTNNYILKGNGTGPITASILWDNGNIGIGTTDPQSLLEVAGVISAQNGFLTNSETITDFTGLGIGLSSGALIATLGDSIDISSETNLGVGGSLLQLSGDTLSVNAGTLTNNYLCSYQDGTGLVCNTDPTSVGHNAVTLSGPLNYLTLSGPQEIVLGAIDLTTDISGILPVANGGTGADTFAHNYVLKGNGTGPITASILWDNGNIGIGTTDPGYSLDISGGDINVSGTYRIGGSDYGQYFINSAGSSGQFWTSNGSGTGSWSTLSATVGGSGTQNYLPIFTAGTTLGSSLIYQLSGNIGIGTTNPANLLDIGTGGGIHIAAGIPGSTNMALYNDSGTLTWNGSALATGSSVSGTTGYISKFTNSSSLGNSVLFDDGSNIGIGTTDPQSLLEVAEVISAQNGFLTNSETITDFTGLGIGLSSGSLIATLGDSIDISSETNLGVGGSLLQLSGDTLSVNAGTLTNNYLCSYQDGTGLVCNTDPTFRKTQCRHSLRTAELPDPFRTPGDRARSIDSYH